MKISKESQNTIESAKTSPGQAVEHDKPHELDQLANSLESESGKDYVSALKNFIDRAIAKLP